MSDYIRPGTQFPTYLQFPEFLLRAPISQTAKLAYAVLYDRARLSLKNDWIANGKIYTVYPIADLAETLDKSQSTIKSVLNELDEAGLLIRKSGGFSKANILYVLVPSIGQFSDEMPIMHSKGGKKKLCDSEFSAPTEGGIPAPNKVIETNNRNQDKRVIQRSQFGKYKNIYLSAEEYAQLKADFPGRADELIEEMSAYLAANGKKYQNYEAALRSWAKREKSTGNTAGSKPGFPDYSCEEEESF